MLSIEEIRTGLEENRFEIRYRGEYELDTMILTSAEALVHYPHPQLGLLQSDAFVQVLEEHNEIYRLDEYVISQVCRMLARRLEAGKPTIPISINISMNTFENPVHVYDAYYTVTNYGISPCDIRFELTESQPFSNVEHLQKICAYLKSCGFSIALDNLGTGHSTLSLLHALPCDTIKISEYFLKNINESRKNQVILESLINLAHELGVDDVCLGIESEQDLEYLKKIGCKYGQGFWDNEPEPIQRFETVLDKIGSYD